MNEKTTYTKISDKEFIKKLENAIKDTNNFCDKLQQEKYKLIEYLEDKIKTSSAEDTYVNGMHFLSQNHALYKELLEKVKSGKYE